MLHQDEYQDAWVCGYVLSVVTVSDDSSCDDPNHHHPRHHHRHHRFRLLLLLVAVAAPRRGAFSGVIYCCCSWESIGQCGPGDTRGTAEWKSRAVPPPKTFYYFVCVLILGNT